MKRLSSKKKSSSRRKTVTMDDPVQLKRKLNMITIGIAVVVALVSILLLQMNGGRVANESPEAAQAREEAAAWRAFEQDWYRVRDSRRTYWANYVANAPQHLAAYAALLRTVAEGNICKQNPTVDGKLLSYAELEKVTILREYQCLEYARDDLIRIAGNEEGVGFLGTTMATLREEYQAPIASDPADSQPDPAVQQ